MRRAPRPEGSRKRPLADVITTVFAGILLLAVSSARGEPAAPPRSDGLLIEAQPLQPALEPGSQGRVILLLRNTTSSPLTNVRVIVHLPEFVRWEWGRHIAAGHSPAAFGELVRLGPLSYARIEGTLVLVRRVNSEAFNAVFEAAYTWSPKPGETEDARVMHALAVKVIPIEPTSIGNIPAGLAVFLVPGLAFLVALSLLVNLPDSLAKLVTGDSRYVIAFVLSAGLVWLAQRFGVMNPLGPVSLIETFITSLAGLLLGALLGTALRWKVVRGQPPHVRHPAVANMSLGELVSTYISQSQTLESIPRRFSVDGIGTLSGLLVWSQDKTDAVLLPRQFTFAGADNIEKRMVDAYKHQRVTRLAKLIRAFPDRVVVTDYIKTFADAKGRWLDYKNGNQPIVISGDKILVRETEERFPLFHVSPEPLGSEKA